jgi:hypothetical protein
MADSHWYYDHSFERENGVSASRISKTSPNTPPSKPEGSDETIAQTQDDGNKPQTNPA